MKFIKKNKYTIIAIIIFIGLVILGVEIKNLLVPDSQKASYGDRLSGIKEHPLTKEVFQEVENKLKESGKIVKFEYQVHGKIINLMITVNNDVNVDDAKYLANSTISMFTNDELAFYSLQVYVLKDDKALNNFPIIGYKGVESQTLSFTHDREIKVEETKDEK